MQCSHNLVCRYLPAHVGHVGSKNRTFSKRCISIVATTEPRSTSSSFLRSSETVYSEPQITTPFDASAVFGLEASRSYSSIVKDSHVGRFYQRSLPKEHVPFTSDKGRHFFRQALSAGYLENYFFLAEQFRTQDEPTFCGRSTLAMVLNSLRIDPMRTWKGAWRWFNEHNISCCSMPGKLLEEGLTMDMFKKMASCNGAHVVAHHAPCNDVYQGETALVEFADIFRHTAKAISSGSDRQFLVVSYCRGALGQTGAGHFSPIGGYHAESDSVLVMDVARFKYPLHWVPLTDMVQAMSLTDPVSGLPRGFLKLSAHPQVSDSASGLSPNDAGQPLHIPQVPRAAGRQLSNALTSALAVPAAPLPAPKGSIASWASRAMCRWLQAASVAEPQVLRRLFQVGDAIALEEVAGRLNKIPLYTELRAAYASLLELGLTEDFPPLRFSESSVDKASRPAEDVLSLNTCGELWILLLLLLPHHMRAAVEEELVKPSISDIAMAVRGPWALPLEALREALGHILQPSSQCSQHASINSGHAASLVR